MNDEQAEELARYRRHPEEAVDEVETLRARLLAAEKERDDAKHRLQVSEASRAEWIEGHRALECGLAAAEKRLADAERERDEARAQAVVFEEALAGTAELRDAVARLHDCPTLKPNGDCDGCLASRALASDAGRAMLDRLKKLEAVVDATKRMSCVGVDLTKETGHRELEQALAALKEKA